MTYLQRFQVLQTVLSFLRCSSNGSLSLFRFIAAVGRTPVVVNTLGTFTLQIVFVLGGFVVARGEKLINYLFTVELLVVQLRCYTL